MYCENCGNQIPDDSRFCEICGACISAELQVRQIPAEDISIVDAPAEPQTRTEKTKEKTVGKKIGIIAAILVLAAAAAIAGRMFTDSKSISMDEIIQAENLEFATILKYDNQDLVSQTYTYDLTEVSSVWNGVAPMEVKPVSRDNVGDEQNALSLVLTESGSEARVEIYVSENGKMGIYTDTEKTYYSGAEAVYTYLDGFVLKDQQVSLKRWIKDNNWDSFSIYLYNSRGDMVDSVRGTDQSEINRVSNRIGAVTVSFSEDSFEEYSGNEIWLFLHGAEMISVTVRRDGCGTVSDGIWSHSFYSEELYTQLQSLF